MLTIDYLADGSPDCPLLRIKGGDAVACRELRDALLSLASGEIDQLEIDVLPGIVASGCRLSAAVSKWDRGVMQAAPDAFVWQLTRGAWDNVAGLIEPFCRPAPSGGYQWLEQAGDLRVLITVDGAW
jgi:hypothetical protein